MTTDSPPSAASVVTISYDDLVHFDAHKNDLSSSSIENKALIDSIGRAFGSSAECLGLIAVEGVPNFGILRERLLRLAYELVHMEAAQLEKCERSDTLYSVGWSCGREQLEAGQPDFSKGSYYANPLTESLVQTLIEREPDKAMYWTQQGQAFPECYADNVWPGEGLPTFQNAFVELGKVMRKTGILPASVCDAYCRQNGVELQLARTLQNSMNAKGRLLHYFPTSRKPVGSQDSWCAWHNDHVRGLVIGCSDCVPLCNSHNAFVTGLPHRSGSRNVLERRWITIRQSRSRIFRALCSGQIR